MATSGASCYISHKASHSITTALASAALEWLLIFMLLIDAIFSYLVTRFARYCKLQAPCLLCSRIDHVLGNEKLGFYWDLICGNHKLEISSLVLCCVHNKLVDFHGMCENCIISCATINKSNSGTYRLLLGQLEAEPHQFEQDPLVEYQGIDNSSIRNCSCCNEPWLLKIHPQSLLRTESPGLEVAELDMPLSAAPQHSYNYHKNSEEPSRALRASKAGKIVIDPLSHIEYTKVKITSDTESEGLFSDNDDDDGGGGGTQIHGTTNLSKDYAVECMQIEPQTITLADDLSTEKLILPDSAPELSCPDSHLQPDISGFHGSTSVPSPAAVMHGLEEFSQSQFETRVDAPTDMKFVSLDVTHQPSNIVERSDEDSTVQINAVGTVKMEQTFDEISRAGSKPAVRSDSISETVAASCDNNSRMANNLDLGDAYKLAIGNKGGQLSGKLLDQRTLKESARLSEDLKLLLSQISAARGIEFPLNEISPRVSGNYDDLKTDSSGSIGIQMLQRRISLERNESGLSLDGSIVSEIEGESEVDRLKRQVEHDKKLMSALYKELEEERNASAVAANQAMAMITRLQEEKATLQMEALQYLRMMEEQAEYDDEALQKANDLLAEKEKEIQDLEAELELHKGKFGNASVIENEAELRAEEARAEHSDTTNFKNSGSVRSSSMVNRPRDCNRVDAAKSSSLDFRDERLYILECLKRLEEKLCMWYNTELNLEMTNAEYLGTRGEKLIYLKELNYEEVAQEVGRNEENDSAMHKQASVIEEIPSAEEGCFPSTVNSELDCGVRAVDLVALRDAISNLISRLEALVSDLSLEDSLKSIGPIEESVVHSEGILSLTKPTKDYD
ncbi:hypothetical protein NMG60_11023586 [Bertholletia excelsa]